MGTVEFLEMKWQIAWLFQARRKTLAELGQRFFCWSNSGLTVLTFCVAKRIFVALPFFFFLHLWRLFFFQEKKAKKSQGGCTLYSALSQHNAELVTGNHHSICVPLFRK